jgi:cobalt-zinc-cadmium efflux system protein
VPHLRDCRFHRLPGGNGVSDDSHGHSHALPAGEGHGRRLALVLGISSTILVVEVIGTLISGSLALLADAGHMLTDVAGLAVALAAAALASRPATNERTWGYRRAEVLAAAAQAAVLLAVGVFVLVEAVMRLFHPPAVASTAMIAFGIVGMGGNAVSICVLTRSPGGNLNTRAALLEVVNDALGAFAVLIAAIIIATTGWRRADALASILIGVLIVPRTWRLLKETLDVLLEATPRHVELAKVREHLLEVGHVQEIHDLHATTVATDLPVLTAHVVVDDSCFYDGHIPRLLDELQDCLADHFDVGHSTFQFEPTSHADHEHDAHA